MSDYAVVYSSLTGNTEKIAAAIYQAIPSSSKDICKIDSSITPDFANNYFIGFYVDKGTAPKSISPFIKQLHGKNIAIFGTCGYGASESYYNQLANNISLLVSTDNRYLGYFLCQGKMPILVRNGYNELLAKDLNNTALIELIHNFDIAMLHPNAEDEKNASDFVSNVTSKIENSN